ncbi:MAG TPA: CPBP family intramembrane glutamic endopeptidase [Candidatus Angelobacter sp.]|nr:CPBP family intramembrane glutamic endopeptidase [Candidatus Angelobacter sp.]
MPVNDSRQESAGKPRQIASWVHLAGYLAIITGITLSGFHTQKAGLGSAPPGQLVEHSQVIKNYFISILADWALFYYCWVGVHWHGGNLQTLTGGRWTSWKQVFVDLAIAFPFWVVWEATAYGVHWLLGPIHARSVSALLPQSGPEILVWILVSLTAGFTEEIQSRGYLQQQFHALSGSIVAAVVGQGLLFGLMHSYQGWHQVIVISVLGVLYGVLAAWRRNLRANMIAHAWSDIWEGWLKQVIWN